MRGCNWARLCVAKCAIPDRLELILLCSGPGGRRFKSSLPDQPFQADKQHFWIFITAAVDKIEADTLSFARTQSVPLRTMTSLRSAFDLVKRGLNLRGLGNFAECSPRGRHALRLVNMFSVRADSRSFTLHVHNGGEALRGGAERLPSHSRCVKLPTWVSSWKFPTTTIGKFRDRPETLKSCQPHAGLSDNVTLCGAQYQPDKWLAS